MDNYKRLIEDKFPSNATETEVLNPSNCISPAVTAVTNAQLTLQHQVLLQTQLGPEPKMITCPACKVNAMTTIKYVSTVKTHILAAALFFVGCCCIPYCIKSCRNANHYCYVCGTYVGTYSS